MRGLLSQHPGRSGWASEKQTAYTIFLVRLSEHAADLQSFLGTRLAQAQAARRVTGGSQGPDHIFRDEVDKFIRAIRDAVVGIRVR